jgi:glycosyltransferase involved in cell wall biosynthesis
LLYVGALQEIKGVDILGRALDHLRDSEPPFDLRVAGTGPYESRLKALARSLGVDDRITWLGYVDHSELPVEYERADAFVYPGRLDEPFGRVLLEALASHTPVVASAVGSTEFIVGDAGVRFTPDDPEALADACHRLLGDYDDHLSAVPDQLSRFDPTVVIDEMLELYAAVSEGSSLGAVGLTSSRA